MAGVGRDLKGPSPTTLLKHVSLQQVTQACVHRGLEYLHRRRLHNLSGQTVSVLCHPYRKEVLHVITEFPRFKFQAITPCPLATHHSEKKKIRLCLGKRQVRATCRAGKRLKEEGLSYRKKSPQRTLSSCTGLGDGLKIS